MNTNMDKTIAEIINTNKNRVEVEYEIKILGTTFKFLTTIDEEGTGDVLVYDPMQGYTTTYGSGWIEQPTKDIEEIKIRETECVAYDTVTRPDSWSTIEDILYDSYEGEITEIVLDIEKGYLKLEHLELEEVVDAEISINSIELLGND